MDLVGQCARCSVTNEDINLVVVLVGDITQVIRGVYIHVFARKDKLGTQLLVHIDLKGATKIGWILSTADWPYTTQLIDFFGRMGCAELNGLSTTDGFLLAG